MDNNLPVEKKIHEQTPYYYYLLFFTCRTYTDNVPTVSGSVQSTGIN